MTLKRQLFIASLLMLLIPWAGLQFVLELDHALRAQAAEQLRGQAERMSRMAGEVLKDTPAISPEVPVIYARQLSRSPNLDGYGDDWPDYDEESSRQHWQATRTQSDENGDAALSWQAAITDRHLYLLIHVSRSRTVYFDPGTPGQPHDYLRLFWKDETGTIVERHIRTSAPGQVVGHPPSPNAEPDYRIHGVWQTGNEGYQVELRMPRLDRASPLGFQARWPHPVEAASFTTLGTSINPLPRLVTRMPALEERLASMLLRGQALQVLESDGWVIARKSLPELSEQPEFDALSPLDIIEQISLNGLRALVQLYQPTPVQMEGTTVSVDAEALPEQGLVQHNNGQTMLLVTQPMEDGRLLVLEQSIDQMLALSGNTLGSVIARSMLLIIGLMLVLLGYASWLSWRITRLQRAVNASVDENGRILANLPASGARDELGELSRQFSQMVDRLQGYTHYLESFSRRLSHELKTPVAVVRSSLENLRHAASEADRENYMARAHAATDRLSQILQGMSEAARLEQSFDHAEKETFDLAEVCVQATQAYQSLDPDHRIAYRGPAGDVLFHGSPELLVQLMDKLVDNARDFTPPQGHIEIRLKPAPRHVELSVFNEGSRLPDQLTAEIFSPFVSLREGKQEGHLGQGLLIVRLIAEHHGGEVHACNERHGVRFHVTLPLAH